MLSGRDIQINGMTAMPRQRARSNELFEMMFSVLTCL